MARTAIQGTDVEKIVAAEVYRAETSVLNKRIRDLESMLELLLPPKSYDSRLDALEAYIQSLPATICPETIPFEYFTPSIPYININKLEGIESGAEVNEWAGDGTNVINRVSTLMLADGTAANTLKVTLVNEWNGDEIAETDNVAKNATTGDFTLDVAGAFLTIENSGLAGAVVALLGAFIKLNTATHIEVLSLGHPGGDIQLGFVADVALGYIDLTAAITAGKYIYVYLNYLIEA